jgi:arylsulfatase A-like enzyme
MLNGMVNASVSATLLLYHPDLEAGRDDRLASHVDVAPTILDAAGVADDHRETVNAMAGHSLLGSDEHDTVFAEHSAMDPPSSETTNRYDLDFSPYERTYKAARTDEYTVRFRSDGTTIAHDRKDPDGTVPDDEIERLRTLVNDRLGWEIGQLEVSDAVREQMERVGYLG